MLLLFSYAFKGFLMSPHGACTFPYRSLYFFLSMLYLRHLSTFGQMRSHFTEERGGSVVESLTQDQGVAGSNRASPEASHCVLEQDTLSSA